MGRRPWLDEAAVAAAIDAVIGGAGWRTAAKQFGISPTGLRLRFAAAGVARRRPPRVGRPPSTLAAITAAQGVPMTQRNRRASELAADERDEILLGIERGESDAVIARRLGRHRCTVWREIDRNGGRAKYRPAAAEVRAEQETKRGRARWFEQRRWLWDHVVVAMRDDTWSPQAVAHQLRVEHPDAPEWWVSHEAIYQAVYLQARGELRKELLACLRSGRVRRKPQGRQHRAESKIVGLVSISERPPEVWERAVPGHWEGDLIVGADSRSYIATLVERTSRYGLLIKLDSKHAEHVAARIAEHVTTLPKHLVRSLTWDRGTELAGHAEFTIRTGAPVFFADPHSPWQRPSNENWNGLARYFLPKGTDLSVHSQDDLDTYARKINGRPRPVLGWKTAAEVFNEVVATTG